MKKEEKWQEYIPRAEKMLENARILGAEIDIEEFTTALIKGLPSKYNIIAMQIDSMDNPTIDNIRRLFELYQERYCNKKKDEHSSAYKHKRSKLECTTQSAIFVGYSSERKAYRICDLKDFSITESRDVKFLENKKGAALLDNDNTTKTQDYFLIEIFENDNSEETFPLQEPEDVAESQEENLISPNQTSLRYNLRPNVRDQIYYELSSDKEPIFDNEDKTPTYEQDEEAFKVSHGDLLPYSYEEAISNPDSTLWRQAMNKEIHSLKDHHVWNLIELPQGAKPIKSKWVFSKKIDSLTNKTLLAYATMRDYEFHHFDVETAFLYGKLTETIYMTQPERYQRQGRISTEDEHRPGRPVESVTQENIDKIHDLVMLDRRMTVRQIEETLGIPKTTVDRIMRKHLSLRKLSARWVPKLLTPDQKAVRRKLSSDNLALFEANPEDIFNRFVTMDETWAHHFTPEYKQQSMQWRHSGSPPPKKAKTVPSAGKVMVSVFWDSEGVLLLDFLNKGQTITGNYYANLVKQLREAIKEKIRGMLSRKIVYHRDNAPSHRSLQAMAAI
ncbi:hypothetical protein LAZ67_12002966 [Cordylochernes scorpioides]|uniref:Retroviral polymerase SH3-like domain-containing protein n=1 Tax=Cordylochernes scorpioides TaxID=51811 RepID=A0ABY6L251_9ARAC|nr:hypothetical protein LAZ67_12002966 [Cordylochernes scorpioides]